MPVAAGLWSLHMRVNHVHVQGMCVEMKERMLGPALRTQEPGRRQRAGIRFLQPNWELRGRSWNKDRGGRIQGGMEAMGKQTEAMGSCFQADDVP